MSAAIANALVDEQLRPRVLRTKSTDGSLMEVAVMKTPTLFQWYQILRKHHRFTMFQAVRSALWLAH